MPSVAVDAFGQRRFESMVAVDEMVVSLAEELEAVGELNETYTIFALPAPQAATLLTSLSAAQLTPRYPCSVPVAGHRSTSAVC